MNKVILQWGDFMKIKLIDLRAFPIDILKLIKGGVECDYIFSLKKEDQIDFNLLSPSGLFSNLSIEGWCYFLPIAQREWLNNYTKIIDDFFYSFCFNFTYEIDDEYDIGTLLSMIDKDNLIRLRDWLIYVLVFKSEQKFVKNSEDNIRLMIVRINDYLGGDNIFLRG